MRKRKILIIAVAAGVIGLSIFVKNRIEAKKRVAIEDIPQEVEQKILVFDLATYAKDGSKKWKLKGDSADILAEIVNLSSIDMETYDEPKIMLTSLKGIYDRKNREISLFEDVEVITSDGIKITTDYLKWHGDTDTITSDQYVKIERSDVTADGIGAEALPQMKKMILKKDVIVRLAKNVIRDEEETEPVEETQEEKKRLPPKTVITCKGPFEIDYEKNIAIFKNDVLVEDSKGKIYSDKMDAFLHPVTKNIVKVIAEGYVKVVQGKDTTYSQKAIYTVEDQKIVLIGKPKIYIRSAEGIDGMADQF